MQSGLPSKQDIRHIFPSLSATPVIKALKHGARHKIHDILAMPIGRQATAEEQAGSLILLKCDVARLISGVCLPTDAGFTGGVNIGMIDMRGLIAAAMAG
jgi:hypothetical protein